MRLASPVVKTALKHSKNLQIYWDFKFVPISSKLYSWGTDAIISSYE